MPAGHPPMLRDDTIAALRDRPGARLRKQTGATVRDDTVHDDTVRDDADATGLNDVIAEPLTILASAREVAGITQ